MSNSIGIIVFLVISILNLSDAIKAPLVAPYVDATMMNDDYLVRINKATGLSAVTLAFVLADKGTCEPHWGGDAQPGLTNPKILTPIKNFQYVGGKVIMATGGAMGPYLESACTLPLALAQSYKKALDLIGTTHLDIDIETSVNLDNMNEALVMLNAQVPNLTIAYTLMVQGDDYGLIDVLGTEVLKNSVKHGVKVDVVNAMTMEFFTHQASWGDAVISAAEATHKQLKTVWPTKSDEKLYAMLGVTPMIGKNFNGKEFQIEHARKLVAWAKSKKIGHLAFWSLGRDNGRCAGGEVSAECSSIAQNELEFTKIFQEYASTVVPGHFPDTVTQAPVTQPPVTQAPTQPPTQPPTQLPHTQPPVTQAPWTQPPVTQPPVTQPPWTQPPVTQPPVTQPPVTHPPTNPQHIDCSVDNKHYPHETDCDKYYWCYFGTAHLETCGPGTVWDQKVDNCNFKSQAARTDCH